MSNDGKLYVKANCSVCLGRKGHSCPYCDEQGLHFIEASQKILIELLSNLTNEEKSVILGELKED